ncbi:MAG: VOC family protein [Pigmentiphaga sp.]|nr:VOC family protein [Pigmentiphaga sp.]
MSSKPFPEYEYLGLPTYMADVAEKSVQAPTSRVLDMGDEVRPTHISHLALATTNFEAMANWWQTVLNAKPSLDAEGMRFMAFDHEHHKVVIFEMKGLMQRTGPQHQFCGMHHIAFTYASFEDLATTYLRLKEAGITPWRAINHGTSFALDYHDPDFNTCELQCSCFPGEQREKQPLNEWLATGAFNRNPIGVLFDMEEAIKAYERGFDVAEIVSPYVMKVGEHTREELALRRMASPGGKRKPSE